MSEDIARKPRVLFIFSPGDALAELSKALKSAAELELEELQGTPEQVWRKAIAYSARICVIYFPRLGDEQVRCIKRIMAGCLSHVILLTRDSPPDALFAGNTRELEVIQTPEAKRVFSDVLSRVRALAKTPLPKRVSVSELAMKAAASGPQSSGLPQSVVNERIIAIGSSTGGTEALAALFHGLRPPMPGIVVVQHMPPMFTDMFAQRLDRELPFDVCEAKNNVRILPNSIHIAPGDSHLRVKRSAGGFFAVVGGTKLVSGHCPSVDVLFESVAERVGRDAVGVILTGMGADGARGMLQMRRSGSFNIGQDEESCIVYGMPRAAYENGAVHTQAALGDIASVITSHLRSGRG